MPEDLRLTTESWPTPAYSGSTIGGRQSAEQVLRDLIDRKEDELDTLRLLLRTLPWATLTIEEDEMLWHYFGTQRR